MTRLTQQHAGMLRPQPFREPPPRGKENRRQERQMHVRPALLDDGTHGVVVIYYAAKPFVLTEAGALTLANALVDALELPFPGTRRTERCAGNPQRTEPE